MIPKRIQIFTSLITLLLTLFSCQKHNIDSSKKTNNQVEIQKLISRADQFHKKTDSSDSAFFYYNKAKANCNLKEDAKYYVYCMYYMAEIQQDHEDFAGSIKTASETLPLLSHLKNSDSVWNIYSVLGRNYYYTYDYPTAIYYYSKAFRLKTNRINKLEAKNNIAVIYLKQQKFDKALPIFLSISNEQIVQKSPESYSKILDYIGYCYYKLKDPRALSFFETSLKIKSKVNDSDGLGRTYYNLAEYYQNTKADLAMKYAKLSYKNFTLSKNSNDCLLVLKFIIENSSAIESQKNAIIYTELREKSFVDRQRAKNQFAKIKYDSKKEKEENLKLKAQKIKNELQLAKQENRNIISYMIIVLASCLIVFVYIFLTVRANRQKIEATYQSETRISKKLHDELANDIYHAMAFAENKNLSSEDNRNDILKKLDDIYSRSTNISKENTPLLSNQNYIASIKQMISGFNTPDVNLLINGLDTISWDNIDKIKKIAVYRSIQELLVNMKKHSEASLVGITFKEISNTITINYNDNGKGIDTQKMVLKNGLHNIENRIHAIKGEIKIQSEYGKGFKFLIKFPL
ncbi:ATP-binding protein [Flavobacterium sp. 17A]|uniref:histidine kinase n=1 Tax=Flavobacterium potami TaxID=2872310 RepID=A0A9X1HFI0_9FLAO|nr:ATP-binding protein [Flavobacterium potami]MBZ4037771.1 ATP-binding protein [Flavobacterium potami]